MTGHVWTPDMLSVFHDLYRQVPELPLETIAAKMSEIFGIALTKNACVGKAHRLNLPQRGHRTGPRKPPNHKGKPKKVRMVRIDAPIEPEPEPTPEVGLTIYQLRDGVCHWPGGAVLDYPPFIYCGEAAPLGTPYCTAHRQKAYSKANK